MYLLLYTMKRNGERNIISKFQQVSLKFHLIIRKFPQRKSYISLGVKVSVSDIFNVKNIHHGVPLFANNFHIR